MRSDRNIFCRIRSVFYERCRFPMKSDADPIENDRIYRSDWISWVLIWRSSLSTQNKSSKAMDHFERFFSYVFIQLHIFSRHCLGKRHLAIKSAGHNIFTVRAVPVFILTTTIVVYYTAKQL
jgi:hypothetical protein